MKNVKDSTMMERLSNKTTRLRTHSNNLQLSLIEKGRRSLFDLLHFSKLGHQYLDNSCPAEAYKSRSWLVFD
jgi:hypothetical protein